jgi:hypothetical protein
MPKHTMTAEEARQLFSYNPETGALTWRKNRGGAAKCGDVAGHVRKDGYRRIVHGGVPYYAHRVAWLLVYGRWPQKNIDHVDGHKDNNRLCNLREATHTENQWNRGAYSNNKCGLKGVCFDRRADAWRATIYVDRRQRHLGYFPNPETAHKAYCKAAKELHGDFANTG